MKGLDLRGFKKVKTEGGYTTLRHPKGHEIRVAHYALDKKMREAIHALPAHEMKQSEQDMETPVQAEETEHFADGGQPTPSPTPSTPPIDPDKAKQVQDSFKNALGFAEGGQVDSDDSANRQANRRMVNGESDTQRVQRINQANAQPTQPQQVMVYGGASGTQYAQGGPVTDPRHHLAEATLHLARSLSAPQVPHYADGSGPIQVPQGTVSLDDAQSALSNNFPDGQQPQAQQPAQDAPQFNVTDPANMVDHTAPQQQTAPVTPSGHSSGLDLMGQAQGAVAQQNKAELEMAGNEANMAGKAADIYGQNGQDMEALRHHFEEVGNDLHQKFSDVADQVEQGKIDPTGWFHNKSTGSKILTALGMMFAGAGAGVSGHPELANQTVNQFIDRDIDAQKANLNNKQTLLSKYMEMYRSLPEAEAAARLTMHAGVEGMINQQAMKLNSQNAVAAATQVNAKRRQDLLPTLEGLARSQAMIPFYKQMMGGNSPGQGGSSDDEQSYLHQMNAMRFFNPEYGKEMEAKYLPGVGVSTSIAIPTETREKLIASQDLSNKLARLELFAQKNAGTVTNRAIVNEGKTLAADAQNAARVAGHQGVFKESDQKFLESMIDPDPTKFLANTRTIPKYSTLRKMTDSTVEQYLKSYGVRKFQKSQSQGHQQIQEGTTAINRTTGKRIVFRNGKWQDGNP